MAPRRSSFTALYSTEENRQAGHAELACTFQYQLQAGEVAVPLMSRPKELCNSMCYMQQTASSMEPSASLAPGQQAAGTCLEFLVNVMRVSLVSIFR